MFTSLKKLADGKTADQRSNLSKQIHNFINMAKLIHELLKSTNPVTEIQVDDIISIYHNLRKLKDEYT